MIFSNEGDGDDDARLQFCKSCEQDVGRRVFRQEEDVAAGAELEDEFKGHAVGVCHGEHGDDVVACFQVFAQCLSGKVEVRP